MKRKSTYEIIKQEIYYHIDEDTGKKVYDIEFMLKELEKKLNNLIKEA